MAHFRQTDRDLSIQICINTYIYKFIVLTDVISSRKLKTEEDQEVKNGGVKLGEKMDPKKKPGCCSK